MEHEVDLELGEDALEQRRVEDRAGELAVDHAARAPGSSGVEVERDDGSAAVSGEARDEAVADLAAGAGDEDDRFAEHGRLGDGASAFRETQSPPQARVRLRELSFELVHERIELRDDGPDGRRLREIDAGALQQRHRVVTLPDRSRLR